MTLREENPVRGEVARRELGKPGPPIGHTRLSAIKQAMGISGQHYIYLSDVRKFLREHPGFSEREIYKVKIKRRGNRPSPQLATVGMSDGSNEKHDQ